MQIHFGTELLKAEWTNSTLCMGTFDGVHLGHRSVIEEAVRQGKSAESPTILVTFDRHPAAILNPERCPKAIAPLHENLRAIREIGASVAVVLPFNAWLSRMSAERFLREMLLGVLRGDRLVVGHDFAMGNGREGTTDWLSARIPTTVVDPFCINEQRVSSSLIRDAVQAGDIKQANRMLGRPFIMSGVVIGGEKLGRTLGFPTVNLARSFDQVTPADGIYAATCQCDSGLYKAAVSIGKRPTVAGINRTIEAFLLDFDGHSLYGQTIDLRFHGRLRDELKFPSLDALTEQMHADVQQVRDLNFL